VGIVVGNKKIPSGKVKRKEEERVEIEVAGYMKIIKEDGLMRELIVEALKRVGINESDVAVRWDKTLGCYVIYVRPGERRTEHERD